jgi:long-chain acyl-CoA synthetase
MERFWHKSWPKDLPHDIEVPELTIHEALMATARKFPNNPAYYIMGRTISFRQIDQLSNQFAHALSGLGVRKGDRIAIMVPNLPQFPVAFFGAFKAGAIVTPVNPLLKELELHHQLESTGAKVLVALDLFHEVAEKGRRETHVETVVYTRTGEYLPKAKAVLGKALGKISYPTLPTGPEIQQFQRVMSSQPLTPPENRLGADDVATLLFTGGTTGLPKGAMLTHRNLMFNAEAGRRWFKVNEGSECFVGVLPFFHAFGLSCVLVLASCIAASIILIPRPDLKEMLHVIPKYHATVLVGVPTLYVSMLAHPGFKKEALKSLKHAFSGAAPLPVEILEQFQRLTGKYIVEGYGMTETSPIQTLIPEGILKPGSVGIPIFNTDLQIVDSSNDTKIMPVGEWGEVLVRGPQVMAGYWEKKKESDETLKGGWMHTGDIGRFDETGYVYIGDRKKDLIKYKAYSVFPAEVEDLLYRHPAVAECGVIGIPDPTAGETIKAFVKLKPEYVGKVTEDELKEWAKQHMAAYKYPRIITFVPSLPKSAIGKILRRELRDAK